MGDQSDEGPRWLARELAQLDSDEERRAAVQFVGEQLRGSWAGRILRGSAVGALALFGVFGGLRALGFQVVLFSLHISDVIIGSVALSCSLYISDCIGEYFRRARARIALFAYLRRRGHPTCVHCGYSLRGVSGAACPECGVDCSPD